MVERMRELIVEERKWLLEHGYRTVETVEFIRAEIRTMIRSLKPFQRVLVHVIEDDAICQDVTIYLKDVQDHLDTCVDDLKELLIMCDRINSEFEKFHQGSMDRTLYLMTIITSIFLPAQFLTGVWGMNFEGSMPELKMAWVYPTFWVCTMLGTIFMLWMFNCGRLNR